jgi:hypothetical protein
MNRMLVVLCVLIAAVTFSWPRHAAVTLPSSPAPDRHDVSNGADPLDATTVFYVSPSGNDSNPGTSLKPWKTFKASLPKLDCGDTLYARNGTYVEDVTSIDIVACSKTTPVLVQAYQDERPVIQGLLWLDQPSYWTFDGINVTWNTSNSKSEHMVKFTNGVGWSFVNAEVWGAHSYAAILVTSSKSTQPSDWTIADNCVHDTYESNDDNQDHLIYINTHNSPGGTVERNILYGASNGAGVKLGGSDSDEVGPKNVVVRYNTIYDTKQNLFVIWHANGTDIYGNLMDKVDLSINEEYGNIRAYQLSGTGNSAYDNLGFEAGNFIYNDPGFNKVADAGGNVFPFDPLFDSFSCEGFHPRSPLAQGFGRYAPDQ